MLAGVELSIVVNHKDTAGLAGENAGYVDTHSCLAYSAFHIHERDYHFALRHASQP